MGQVKIEAFGEDQFSNSADACRALETTRSAYLHSPDEWAFLKSILPQRELLCFASRSEERPEFFLAGSRDGERFDYWGRPLLIAWGAHVTSLRRVEVVSALFEELKARGIRQCSFQDDSFLLSAGLKEISAHRLEFRGSVDLSSSEQEIRSGIRKSYRSLCNWGQKNLVTRIFSRDMSWEDMELFREFHRKVSGRETRSVESWRCQHEAVLAGHGFVVWALLADALVSAILVLHGDREAFYGVAVNDRDVMAEGKAVGHWPLLASILHAKSLGLKRFDLGPILSDQFDEKERSIAVFKAGFSQYSHSSLSFTYTFDAGPAP